ncbi:8-oxoguanine deaminase [Falsiroseomonas selenitidurans]|uniref:8-oxoguanine deaminase n=1 Tax=Falsiroseomonas selenitidurans TaxID=2716335 RepID=A0ABX1E4K4_9PROT|nr:8-oxoguanine deaminase [Falsiroseomonas selenitidurans]NKC29860.1 8-oxoguanine deaminase [Falsiroseomonas selenitidurans]
MPDLPPKPDLLLRNAAMVITMNAARRELPGGWVLLRGGAIEAVGSAAEPCPPAAESIDLAGHILLPGLVNTHHHMFQTLTRVVAQDATLFDWLTALYPIWARMRPEDLRLAATTAMAELMLSGCTTAADHLYLFPNGRRLEDTIEAAGALGLRFHATRGAMSLGRSRGGLPPDVLVEDEAAILRDMERVLDRLHDPAPLSMLRIGLAPCSPFSVTRELMRDAAALGRARGVMLHTHLAEDASDVAFSRARFNCTPAEYAEEVGWLGPDVWHAHCVKLDADGIGRFARSGTGVAHCPCSNMRLASGIAPVTAMRRAGVTVGLGLDGTASNDGGHLLGEARQAMLLARIGAGPGALGARDVLEMATLGGARVLGRADIGALVPGLAADLVAFDLHGLDHAGAEADPVAALVFCTPARVALSIIAGRVVVRDGVLTGLDARAHAARHRAAALRMAEG